MIDHYPGSQHMWNRSEEHRKQLGTCSLKYVSYLPETETPTFSVEFKKDPESHNIKFDICRTQSIIASLIKNHESFNSYKERQSTDSDVNMK